MIMERAQRLDDLGRTLNVIINTKLVSAQQKMTIVSAFPNILQNRMQVLNQSLQHMEQMLNSLSYKSVLLRGYAIVRDINNNIISSVDGGVPNSIEFADGVLKL